MLSSCCHAPDSLFSVCLGRLDDAREPGGLTTAMRLSAGVARLCFEHEAVVLDAWGAHWEDVLMSVCVCVCGVCSGAWKEIS